MSAEYHVPVLFAESLAWLDIRPDGTYVDLTFGGGGHSRGILENLGPQGRLYGFDQDADARANAPDDSRFHFVESNFRFLRGALRFRGVTQIDGILADLGVSSHHFDTPERGFSFRFDGPLDMRMNRRGRLTAEQVVNGYSAEELTRVLRTWGEVEMPHRVAAAIERARAVQSITTIEALVEAVRPCIPKREENRFLSKVFQGIRIEVNREMEALRMMLEQSLKVLCSGGRLAVISYHSLEDRMVKNFMRSGNTDGNIEKDFYGQATAPFEVLTRKALVPSETEFMQNPRARSARLRVAEKK